jgi:hypothetical protein
MARTIVSKHADAVNETPFKGAHHSMWESTQLRLSGAIIGVIFDRRGARRRRATGGLTVNAKAAGFILGSLTDVRAKENPANLHGPAMGFLVARGKYCPRVDLAMARAHPQACLATEDANLA